MHDTSIEQAKLLLFFNRLYCLLFGLHTVNEEPLESLLKSFQILQLDVSYMPLMYKSSVEMLLSSED